MTLAQKQLLFFLWEVHKEYYLNGADVCITASYQVCFVLMRVLRRGP